MNKLNEYESVIIIKDSTEEEYKKIYDEIIEKVKKIVDIDKIEELGLKNLAYEIRKNKKGYYVILYFKAKSEDITELERMYRITDEILKFIVVRKED